MLDCLIIPPPDMSLALVLNRTCPIPAKSSRERERERERWEGKGEECGGNADMTRNEAGRISDSAVQNHRVIQRYFFGKTFGMISTTIEYFDYNF